MSKIIAYLSSLLFSGALCLPASAQSAKPLAGVLHYRQITGLTDTNRRTTAYCLLRFNQHESVSRFTGKFQGGNALDSIRRTTIPALMNSNRYASVYTNLKTSRMVSRQQAFTELVLVDDSLQPIQWTIHSDRRLFNTLNTQKATARVRGRDYTAWFCPDIPVSTGPWKLFGLPGLILEAYDDKGHVRFLFESLTIPDLTKQPIIPPILVNKRNYKSMNEKEFVTKRRDNLVNSGRMANAEPSWENSKTTFKSTSIELYPD